MNVKELYEHITKHMTPEQALLKLLEGTVIEYEKLKFSEEGKEIHPEVLIITACIDRGWDIAIPKPKLDGTDDDLHGMIIGDMAYITNILDNIEFVQALKGKELKNTDKN